MRPSRLLGLIVATFAALTALPATAMYKCTARDGTVLYQARPCVAGDKEASVAGTVTEVTPASFDGSRRKLADNDPRLPSLNARSPRDAEERAVMDRDLAQRRSRCGSYRDVIERQKPLFDSPNEITRQHAANEVKIQERRMREDQCATL